MTQYMPRLARHCGVVAIVILAAAVLWTCPATLRADESAFRIVTLGDSITRGVRPGVTAAATFAARLQKSLRERNLDAEVVNVGVGGERTDQALARLDESVIALEPQLVTVMYGTNDSYVDRGKQQSRVSEEAFGQNLAKIVRRLREHGIEVVLMTEPRWAASASPDGLGGHPNLRLAPYVEITRQVARETKSPLVDHSAHWALAESQGVDLADWTTDLLHPNPRGHQIMAETMLPVVAGVVERMRSPKKPPG